MMLPKFALTMRSNLLLAFSLLFFWPAFAQRQYRDHSVLFSGNWFKISTSVPGVYKVDLAFCNSIGLNVNGMNSSQLRLFGNGGQMLPEKNSTGRTDDLAEVALDMHDGGDGVFNNQDYFLFFAPGPDAWKFDPAGGLFLHEKNLYNDKSFYFLSIGGTGKRITTAPAYPFSSFLVNSYDFHFFHENDSINFLGSGKQWYGEEFSNAKGNTQSFNAKIPNVLTGSAVQVRTTLLSRSASSFSRFELRVNNALVLSQDLAFTGNGPYDPFAVEGKASGNFIAGQEDLSLKFTYAPGNASAQGWLDHYEIQGRASLSLKNLDQFIFRDRSQVSPGRILTYQLQNVNTSTSLWVVTDVQTPLRISSTLNGSQLQYSYPADKLEEFIAFNDQNFKIPQFAGRINNQDLHAYAPVDLIIVCGDELVSEARRIADFHFQKNNLKVAIATTSQVFNEFSSGSQDPTAIRDFVKMYYDKAGANILQRPANLLLFGDASFDYKNRISNNTNLVPGYQSPNSLEPLGSFTSDDFFGFLDDQEDINDPAILNLLDIGIGRIPAANIREAKNAVDKVIAYSDKESFGPWRNEITLIADDEDNNLHFEAAESIYGGYQPALPFSHTAKVYLDAYRQQSGSNGAAYPEANIEVNNLMLSGNLIWNYLGHGSYRRLAEENILDAGTVESFTNKNKLPLFITATCDFAPYDNPLLPSLGENLLLRPATGAIALLTSSRVVFANANKNLNENFLTALAIRSSAGNYRSLGEALKNAKNFNYQNYPEIINNRKFTLLGDPALTLAFPFYGVRTTSVNGRPVTAQADTLRSLGKYTISGEITDLQGNLLPAFSGLAYAVIFTPPQSLNTLANDPGSMQVGFMAEKNALYRGKVNVLNGKFSYTFIVPRDINANFGQGRVSYYADDGKTDANGGNAFIIGGISPDAGSDKLGPEIRAFLNDEKFINGSLTNNEPVLILKLFDSSGINTSGAGIGHDITAVLDNDNRKIFELNSSFASDTGSYQRGSVRFQLPRMEDGPHRLSIKAWDVFNNSSEQVLDFRVAGPENMVISHVLNYPNPFTTRTNFWFEHNMPAQDLLVTVKIFTIAGKQVKYLRQAINTAGNRSSEVGWDGRDDYGQKLGRGAYLYELKVESNGKSFATWQKLVLL